MGVNFNLFQKQPWLIAPEALGAMFSSARSFFDQNRDLPPPPVSPCLTLEEGVGIVNISGPMLRNPDAFDRLILGACDTEEITLAINEAAGRDDVEAIFLDIDSPGGSVNGTPELAQAVARASKTKYVYAFSAGQMCSAAYWVASQADAIYATPSARIGSIGVILPVVDCSGAFEQAGFKVEVFAAGKYKSAGTPGTSLTDDQRQWLQAEVEETAADFRNAILARGRKIPDEAMEGQTFSARRAMRFNLSGIVESRDDAMSRLRLLHVAQVDTAARSMTSPNIESELAQARERVAKLEADSSASEALLAEANSQISQLSERLAVLDGERQIEASALALERADKAALETRLKVAEDRVATLEASERDIEKRASLRAAQIVAQTGTSAPVHVTPMAEKPADNLLSRFQAITDPGQQTTFWQGLTPDQKSQLISTSR